MQLSAKQFMSNQIAGVVLVLLIIIALSSYASEYFLTSYNILIITRTLSFIAMIAIGQSLLMLLGELDLSLGSIAGLSGILGGMLMVNLDLPPYLAVVLCLAAGGMFGLINGLLVTTLKLSSLVVTIGMTGVYSGAILVMTKGVAITGIPTSISFLGKGVYLGVPMPFWIMLIFLAVISFICAKTPFGRYIYAIGNNSETAKILGIKVNRVKVICFTIAGLMAALAGILMVARLGTAQPSIGKEWVLPSIAASVIGGVAVTGGIGLPVGALLGAAIIGVIQNIIVLFGVSPYWQSVVSGLIVVLAIAFDSISRQYFGKQ